MSVRRCLFLQAEPLNVGTGIEALLPATRATAIMCAPHGVIDEWRASYVGVPSGPLDPGDPRRGHLPSA